MAHNSPLTEEELATWEKVFLIRDIRAYHPHMPRLVAEVRRLRAVIDKYSITVERPHRQYTAGARSIPETPSEEIRRAQLDATRLERGHDIPTICVACGAKLPDVCVWHPLKECVERKPYDRG